MTTIKSYIVTNAAASQSGGGGSGTVTNFSAGDLAPFFTSSVDNPTTTPAHTFNAISQSPNVFAASPSGVPGAFTARALVRADLPFTGTPDGTKFLGDDLVWKTISSGGGHVIENNGTPLTARANLNFRNGLSAADNISDTDALLGGTLIQTTLIDVGTFTISITSTGGSSLSVNDGIGALIAGSLGNQFFAEEAGGLVIEVQDNAAVFTDSRAAGFQAGLEYIDDTYGADFTTATLIHRAYADARYAQLGAANVFGDFDNSFRSNRLRIANPANTFFYSFTGAAIAANRVITLPLLTGNDVMVTADFTQTLTNKTISGASNTITNVSLTTGITGILGAANGGTGIANNAASTLTISGNFATTLTVTGTTTVTIPVSGTIASLSLAQTWTAKQIFQGTSTTGAPITISFSGTPSSLTAGDLWYNSVTSQLIYRTGAISRFIVDCGSGGFTSNRVPFVTAAQATLADSANFTFVTNRILGTTLYLTVSAGTATAGTAPIKMTTSGAGVTGLLTTAEKGAFEFTDRGLWFSPAASVRDKVLHGLVGAAAPATNAIGVVVDYYGTSATRVLTTPSTWISIVGDDGNTYKIPAYS